MYSLSGYFCLSRLNSSMAFWVYVWSRSMVERRLTEVSERLKKLRHELSVADEQLGVGGEVRRRLAAGVGERIEIVEHAHPLAGGEQRLDQVAADEPGAAGDEDLHAPSLAEGSR